MATVVVHHTVTTGAPADTSALVDGPAWDAAHTVTGLENVDNTSDANKPVSTAQAAALALKLNITSARERLTAGRTYYVRTDGNDNNTGLANTSGGAFLTVQAAINATAALDLQIYDVTIQIADGTYTGGVVVNGPWLGSGTVTIQGNNGTPSNVILSTGSSDAISVRNGGRLTVRDMKIQNTSGSFLIYAQSNGYIDYGNIVFGAATVAHVRTLDGGAVSCSVNYTIAAGSGRHWSASGPGAVIRCQNRTITISGTPAFSVAFAEGIVGGQVIVNSDTFSGSATGSRYSANSMGMVYTGGAGTTYLPGDSAGSGTNPSASPYGLYN